MIKEYDYSSIIKNEDQSNLIKLIDYLIKTGNWVKDAPTFQTKLESYDYEYVKIFKKTFLKSCFNYLDLKYTINNKVIMSCYRDNIFNNLKKNQEDMWHCHEIYGKISGIYYLKNLRKEGTEFKDFKLEVKPYTWFIYPSYLLHKPPKIKSIRNRYTLVADFYY